jgi:hypothetical protein
MRHAFLRCRPQVSTPGTPTSFTRWNAALRWFEHREGKGRRMQNLNEKELAERWRISPRTLQGWRQQGKGPRYRKIEGRVIYPLPEVEAYEATNLHANTTGPLIDGNESGRVDDAEAASIGDNKGTGGRTARRSGPSQPRSPPAASQPPGAARAGKRAVDDRGHRGRGT